jgi:hypothetical protein|tara:strand:+ start:744 stop:1007 length:264 start_codon:yes stop_codon:yes gene_type:complete
MVNIAQIYFATYFTEIIIVILVLSIAVVVISIFYVLFSSTEKKIPKKQIHINDKKVKKIKYTKQFLKGVDGIDLDLKVSNKKAYRKT